MGNFGNYFIFIMAFVAIIDRFIFRRKSVEILSIGDAVVKESAIAFPVSLRVKRSWVSNAQIEYWLQDLKNPSVVISGKRDQLTPQNAVREKSICSSIRNILSQRSGI